MLTDLELLRLYVADPVFDDDGEDIIPQFEDAQLQHAIDNTTSVEAAAAEVWRWKMAVLAEKYAANIDGSFLLRDTAYKNAKSMCEHFASMSGGNFDFESISMVNTNIESSSSSSEF